MRPSPVYGLDGPHVYESEALLRLAAARRVLDALLIGEWIGSTGILDETANLISAASADMQRARLAVVA